MASAGVPWTLHAPIPDRPWIVQVVYDPDRRLGTTVELWTATGDRIQDLLWLESFGASTGELAGVKAARLAAEVVALGALLPPDLDPAAVRHACERLTPGTVPWPAEGFDGFSYHDATDTVVWTHCTPTGATLTVGPGDPSYRLRGAPWWELTTHRPDLGFPDHAALANALSVPLAPGDAPGPTVAQRCERASIAAWLHATPTDPAPAAPDPAAPAATRLVAPVSAWGVEVISRAAPLGVLSIVQTLAERQPIWSTRHPARVSLPEGHANVLHTLTAYAQAHLLPVDPARRTALCTAVLDQWWRGPRAARPAAAPERVLYYGALGPDRWVVFGEPGPGHTRPPVARVGPQGPVKIWSDLDALLTDVAAQGYAAVMRPVPPAVAAVVDPPRRLAR